MQELQVRVLKALADKTRFQMVTMLLHRSLCVGALAKRLGITEAAVSQHLRVLKLAGLVSSEKRGYYVHSSINVEVLADLAEALSDMASSKVPVDESCGSGEPGRCHKRCQHRG